MLVNFYGDYAIRNRLKSYFFIYSLCLNQQRLINFEENYKRTAIVMNKTVIVELIENADKRVIEFN